MAQQCHPSSLIMSSQCLFFVIPVPRHWDPLFFFWIPASRAGMTPFDEHGKPLIFDFA
ncbi:hypothetical protein [Wolbachia endosymbiont of Ctenocephalides felis wCfeJ]|uniref:hypothetical protein n=1 Tax=Wolbachia endosymbiont of Ctenocephalides felis wCfeJ TaxID=2732594 RepID=UPI00144678FB|nr:hypothetical protein [Wolbachia endosymbiont of Ctenocephalides felis wCfeJ]